ncbi:DMT family transporter [Puniceicoccaceae bacterium K14]|nr:DMT family transporter [Puniceicoccaceae bacterium K14]
MTPARIALLTTTAMAAFAGNSLLCRIALRDTAIDPANFTSIRIISGALTLWFLASLKTSSPKEKGNNVSALALFAYAAGFSYAYINLTAATGALILFGTVQTSMISYGLWSGERLKKLQLAGLIFAFAGLTSLLLPGLSAPPLKASILMIISGIGWAIYSIRGKRVTQPTVVTAGNFLRAIPITITLSLATLNRASMDTQGIIYAILSGALASGIGYVIWYAALPALKATNAATIQLSVPVIAAFGGILFLNEPITVRFILASIAVLGGIALVIRKNN